MPSARKHGTVKSGTSASVMVGAAHITQDLRPSSTDVTSAYFSLLVSLSLVAIFVILKNENVYLYCLRLYLSGLQTNLFSKRPP